MTTNDLGKTAGYGSIAASLLLWGWGISVWAHLTQWAPAFWVLCIPGILSLALPIIAGWKASKLWFLMFLSPIVGYIVVMAHTCG